MFQSSVENFSDMGLGIDARGVADGFDGEGGWAMKGVCAIGLLIIVLVALPLRSMAGVTWKIGDESELDFGLSIQALARLTDYLRFFVQAAADASTADGAGLRLSDANLNVHYKEIAQLIMGLQKPPVDREMLTSDDALMTIDRPGITGYKLTSGLRGRVEFNTATLRNTNSGVSSPVRDRDIGATLFGVYSFSDMLHFKYYAGLYEGIQKHTEHEDQPRYTARMQVNLFDPEPGYENLGTYLGTKRTIALGWSMVDVQNNVVKNARNDEGAQYFSANTVDLFIEYPVGPGSVTSELSVEHT